MAYAVDKKIVSEISPPAPELHVHTETCYKDNLACALAYIEKLSIELGAFKTAAARAGLMLREAGGLLDKAEAGLDRALNMEVKG